MNEIVGDPLPSVEARRGLLEDIRSIRDLCMQERARAENQLYAAQQSVSALETELRIADEKLNIVEDLVGEVRTRMHRRGLATHPVTQRLPPKTFFNAGISDKTPPREFLPSHLITHN